MRIFTLAAIMALASCASMGFVPPGPCTGETVVEKQVMREKSSEADPITVRETVKTPIGCVPPGVSPQKRELTPKQQERLDELDRTP